MAISTITAECGLPVSGSSGLDCPGSWAQIFSATCSMATLLPIHFPGAGSPDCRLRENRISLGPTILRNLRGRFRPKDEALVEVPPISSPPDPTPRQITRGRFGAEHGDRPTADHDDLSPEFLGFPVNGFAGFATLNSSQGRSPLGVSNTVAAFVEGALSDTLGRVRSIAGRPAGYVLQTSSIDSLVDWARRVQIEQFVTPYSPVGPAQEALDILERKLEPLGIGLERILRTSDALAWPRLHMVSFVSGNKFRRSSDVMIEHGLGELSLHLERA